MTLPQQKCETLKMCKTRRNFSAIAAAFIIGLFKRNIFEWLTNSNEYSFLLIDLYILQHLTLFSQIIGKFFFRIQQLNVVYYLSG